MGNQKKKKKARGHDGVHQRLGVASAAPSYAIRPIQRTVLEVDEHGDDGLIYRPWVQREWVVEQTMFFVVSTAECNSFVPVTLDTIDDVPICACQYVLVEGTMGDEANAELLTVARERAVCDCPITLESDEDTPGVRTVTEHEPDCGGREYGSVAYDLDTALRHIAA